MEIKGMKGLHEICKRRAAGLAMPDQTSIGEDIKLVLSIDSKVTKEMLREFINRLDQEPQTKGLFQDAKIIAYQDLP